MTSHNTPQKMPGNIKRHLRKVGDIGSKPTYLKLAKELDISKERVRQLHLRAMNKLRDSISDLQLAKLDELF